MMIVALTGGIGSGKSEAAKEFAALGVPVVDVDVIAHELTAIGQPLLKKISALFGIEYLNSDGALNRTKLREHVFNEPAERLKLDALLHPAIHERALAQLAENQKLLHSPYQLLVIPLLLESRRYQSTVDKILVIDCDETLQIKRAMTRSQMREQEVKQVMNAQVTRAYRLKHADEVISNNGTLAELHEKIVETHKKFINTCLLSK